MSDPQKVARLVLTVAELNEPPLRFSPAAMPTNTAARPAASDRDRREMGVPQRLHRPRRRRRPVAAPARQQLARHASVTDERELLFGSQAAETTIVTIACIPWIPTTRGANTAVVNRYATLAAVCMLIPFGTAPLASADPPPDPSVESAVNPASPPARRRTTAPSRPAPRACWTLRTAVS